MDTRKTCYLFLDFDGTVFLDGKYIPQITCEALATVQRAGHQVILNTGRSRGGLDLEAPRYKGVKWDGMIFGGADYTYRGERHCDHRMVPEEARAWFLSAIDRRCWIHVECEVRNRDFRFDLHPTAFTDQEKKQLMREYEESIRDNPVTKLSLGVTEMRNEPTEHTNVISQLTYLELFPEGMDKGAILKEFCGQYGIDRTQCISFGDSMNDLAAFEFAAQSVSMKGSPKPLEDAATYCAKTDFGVAEGVKYYFPTFF